MSTIFLLNNSKSILLFPNGFSLLKKEKAETILEKTFPNTSVSFLPPFAKDFFALSNDETETVDIIFDLFPPMLIPKALYNESTAYDSLGAQFDISGLGQLLTEEIEEYNTTYFINHNEINALKKININPRFTHLSSLIFQNLQDHSFYHADNLISLFINDSYVDFILIKSQTIHLVNRFNFTSEFDILYYLFNIIIQYGIKAENCKIILFRNQSNKIAELLTKFFPAIAFIG